MVFVLGLLLWVAFCCYLFGMVITFRFLVAGCLVLLVIMLLFTWFGLIILIVTDVVGFGYLVCRSFSVLLGLIGYYCVYSVFVITWLVYLVAAILGCLTLHYYLWLCWYYLLVYCTIIYCWLLVFDCGLVLVNERLGLLYVVAMFVVRINCGEFACLWWLFCWFVVVFVCCYYICLIVLFIVFVSLPLEFSFILLFSLNWVLWLLVGFLLFYCLLLCYLFCI